jgi:hypothetical protein
LLLAKIWVLVGRTTGFAFTFAEKVLSRVADVPADCERPIQVNVAFDAILDRFSDGFVVLDPVFEMVAVDEKVVDIIFVIV